MHVLEAIKTRKSIRAFTDQNVSKETVEEILQIAQRSPSGTNTQPWHVHVCAGDIKQAITDDVLALASSGASTPYQEYDYYPGEWKDIHRDRRRGVGGWTGDGSLWELGTPSQQRITSAASGGRGSPSGTPTSAGGTCPTRT